MHNGSVRRVSRLASVTLVDAVLLLLLAEILPGFNADGFGAALALAILLGLANALLWPLLIRFALPFTVLTLGLGALILNGVVLLAIAAIDTGIHVEDLGSAIVVTLALTVLSSISSAILALDSGDLWYRTVVRRQLKRTKLAVESDVPGILFLEIDGLAHEIVQRALRDGNAPALARWIHDGSHELKRWETDWSSQTGACQAGILHGRNTDMPAFRWWEKEHGRAIVTNHPKDAAELERRASDGARPAARRRRQPREHPLRRRAPLAADDEHGARSQTPGPARAGLLRLLRQPVRRRADVHALRRRDRLRALVGDPAGAARRATAHQPRRLLPADARLRHRDPARPAGRRRHRRRARRPPRRLHDLPRLRRGRAPLRRRAAGDAGGAAAGRPRDRPHRRRRRARAAPVQTGRARRPRAEPGRDLPAALRRVAGAVRRAQSAATATSRSPPPRAPSRTRAAASCAPASPSWERARA